MSLIHCISLALKQVIDYCCYDKGHCKMIVVVVLTIKGSQLASKKFSRMVTRNSDNVGNVRCTFSAKSCQLVHKYMKNLI